MILIFGTTGQVARALAARSGPRQFKALSRAEADLADPAACAAHILAHGPQAVINAAAYTAVDRAEEEEALATTINGKAPGAMAQVCANAGIPFLHVSTDYVFDGAGEVPFAPHAATAPLNAYGRSKLAGEEAIRAAGGVHLILRTSWVFSEHGNNFVKTMLRLSETRDTLSVVNDQIGGPTPASGIADALWTLCDALLAGQGGGTYHFAGAPFTSWQGFARETLTIAGHDTQVQGIATTQYPTPARRPLNSRLDCSTLTRDFGIVPADWATDLHRIVKGLT